MVDEKQKHYLRVEYTDEFEDSTNVERYFDVSNHDTQFEAILRNICYSLLAIGFGKGLIEKYVDLDF